MNIAKLLRKTLLHITSDRLVLPRQKHIFCFLVNLAQLNSFSGGYIHIKKKKLLAFREVAFNSRYDCLLSRNGGSTSYCIFCWYHWLWRISNNLWIEHVSRNFSFFFDKFDFLFLKFEQDQIQKRRSICAVRSFPDSTKDYNLSRNSLKWNGSIMHSSKKTFISMKTHWYGLGIWEKCSRTLFNIEPHDRFYSWHTWLVTTRF